ncbi:hypothetical protein PIB30_087461, partial [Stylosanthes scabra]|nr:hypothetical protein [Stylosanthes scabra]
EIEENKARKQRKKKAWEARFGTHYGHVWASKAKRDPSHVPQGLPISQDQLGSQVWTKQHQGRNVTLTRPKEARPSLPPTTFGKGRTTSRRGLSLLTTPRRGS